MSNKVKCQVEKSNEETCGWAPLLDSVMVFCSIEAIFLINEYNLLYLFYLLKNINSSWQEIWGETQTSLSCLRLSASS